MIHEFTTVEAHMVVARAAEALNDRAASERAVERALSNLSAPEIAGELYLSVNTVRTHIRHIYAKLAAHTRSEAVDRARSLGLLGGAPGS